MNVFFYYSHCCGLRNNPVKIKAGFFIISNEIEKLRLRDKINSFLHCKFM